MPPDSPLVVYVDIDDTLVRTVGAKRIPIPSVVQHVRELHAAGAVLYGWSTAGATYAGDAARELGIASCFAGFLPKPHVILDDQAVGDWRGTIHALPGDAAAWSVADYRERLSARTRR